MLLYHLVRTSPAMAALSSMSRKEILGKVYKMVPPMLEKFHKGEHETTGPSMFSIIPLTDALQVSLEGWR